ncbi:tail fiber domain-containing protein [bacterium]|nr:tail fiber domain-containing protein [bacterium]
MRILFRAQKKQALTYAEMDTNLGSFFYSSSISHNNLYLHYTGSMDVPVNREPHVIPLATGTVQGDDKQIQFNNRGNLAGASGLIYSDSKVGINTGRDSLTYSLEVSGSIRASAGILSNSDKRLKENIYLIDNALSKVNKIEGVYFNWKDKKETQVGVIAQQVKEVLPEVVSEDKSSYLSVDYSKLVPLLIGAVNEQSSVIEGLEKRIAKLEE